MKQSIIIRADGSSRVGMGHVVRSLALAGMLANDFEVIFAIQNPDAIVIKTIQKITGKIIMLPLTDNYSDDASRFSRHLKQTDIVVLDGYNFKTAYQETIKATGCKLVCIDDLHAWHQPADAIINYAVGIDKSAYSAEPYTKFYLGLNYILLRKPFLKQASKVKRIRAVRKVFISMGAADISNLSYRFAEALLEITNVEEIHIMLGSVNPHLESIEDLIRKNKQMNIIRHFNISAEELSRLLLECDVAICPASTISLECCAAGTGLISGYTSENQLEILNGLIKLKAAVNFGNMNEGNVKDIKMKIEELTRQPELFNELIVNQRKMIDGKSPDRLREVFKELSESKLHFRFAVASDVDLYFKWVNDPLVRLNSYNKDPVVYEDHVKWFQSKLSSDCRLYLFLNEQDIPAGQVRIEKSDGEIVAGVSVDEAFRGKSMGVELLNIACTDYLLKNPGSTIVAYIKSENRASRNIFLKAGFTGEQMVTVQGYKSYRLYKN